MYRAFEGGGLGRGAGGRCEMGWQSEERCYRIWVRAFGGCSGGEGREDVLLLPLLPLLLAASLVRMGWMGWIDVSLTNYWNEWFFACFDSSDGVAVAVVVNCRRSIVVVTWFPEAEGEREQGGVLV